MTSSLFGVAATVVGACSSSSSPTAPASRTVSMGGGLTATLGVDGTFSIAQGGKALLATASGQPLLTRDVDANDPSGYHDPKALANDTFTKIADSAIELDSPAPGVVHLSTTADAMPTVLVSLALAADDGFYTGLGERYDHTDARGQIVGMQLEIDGNYESGTTDRHVPVPWLVSSRGYGVFVKSREAGAWDVASTDTNVVRATFEGAAMDVTIVVDPDPLAVVAALTKMTGLPRATPTWALAPMMWRHVDTQSEALGDLQMIRSLHIPTTTFWIDDGWQVALNTLDFDTTKFPDASLFAQQATALGFELLGWNSPYVQNATSSGAQNEAQQLYPTLAAANAFVEESDGTPFSAPGPDASEGFGLIDFTSSAASAYWTGRAENAVRVGLNGFKLDYAEDMVPDILGGRLNLKLSDGESERTARNYPLGYHGAYRAALAPTSDGGVLLVRASTYGGAQVADIVWPGDLDNGFQHRGDVGPSGTLLVGGLPASIVAAQTLSASGFPLYGADTGGYRGGAPTKEALIRWAEHTALSMVMQLGPGENKYPWSYDADTVSLYTTLANLHQELVPYLTSLLVDAQTNGTPTIRPLPLAYPTDTEAAAAADDEYMLGPDLLVAPVVTDGATSRQVYLPPGSWIGWWDGVPHIGPTSISVDAPLGQPPLFARSGALVPLYPGGIDTMIAATDASTVTLASRAGFDVAMSWVNGDATATFPDGSTVTVNDEANDVEVVWTPMGTGHVLTITLDVATRAAASGSLSTVTVASGGALMDLGPAGNVDAATTGAYSLIGETAVLRLFGAADVRIE